MPNARFVINAELGKADLDVFNERNGTMGPRTSPEGNEHVILRASGVTTRPWVTECNGDALGPGHKNDLCRISLPGANWMWVRGDQYEEYTYNPDLEVYGVQSHE